MDCPVSCYPKLKKMKRNSFLKVCLLTTPFLSAPYVSYPQFKMTSQPEGRGFKIPAGEGRIHGHLTLKGVNANILDLKISGKDTEGGMAIFEQTSLTQGMGTPLHVHHFQNETFFVEEGHYFFRVGDDEFDLSPGDSIFLPKKISHAWTQISQKGKMVVTFQPAGKMENFFVTLASMDHEPTKEEMAKIFKEHEMEIVGPVLIYDKK